LFTPTCLDADSLRYYMVSLKPGTCTFLLLESVACCYRIERICRSACHSHHCVAAVSPLSLLVITLL